MNLLYSSIKPCEYNNSSFSEVFENGLVESDCIKITTGYISEESLLELKSILLFYLEEKKIKKCSLVIGMHWREGFTRAQYEAAIDLASFLKDKELGNVYVCTAFKYHGKTYVFRRKGEATPISAVLGSSNLSNILDSRQYEVDVLFTEGRVLSEIDELHDQLVSKASRDILEMPTPGVFIERADLLADRIDVEKVSQDEYEKIDASSITGRVFDIPLKTEAKSNLNAYFGKGRLAVATGAIRPRHWYEAELVVSREITAADGYPKPGSVISVLTDDGWRFKCKIQGDYGKNFRSEGDLKTLGRWIKGRLERAGCLKVGQPVTDEVLKQYGRSAISLKETTKPDMWLLDFSI
jgi:HKD family nuclease